jgi:hypothetical protein
MELQFAATSEVALQHIIESNTLSSCAGDLLGQAMSDDLEYFVIPAAYDVQASTACCGYIRTWERAAKISFITLNDFQAQFGFAFPPIPAGQNAGFIDSKLNAQATPALVTQIKDWVDNCPFGIEWQLRTEMDACLVNGKLPAPSPNTICQKPFCFQVAWDDGASDMGYQLFESSP